MHGAVSRCCAFREGGTALGARSLIRTPEAEPRVSGGDDGFLNTGLNGLHSSRIMLESRAYFPR